MTLHTKRLAVIMDPIESVSAYKDTTVGMIWAAQRKFSVDYILMDNIWLESGVAKATVQSLKLDNPLGNGTWYDLGETSESVLGDYDVILMRKDPPFNMEYIYATYILDRAQLQGAYVSNQPEALRNINEKAYTAWFPELCPPTLITRSMQQMADFQTKHGTVVVKPLDGMGGKSIFVIRPNDGNRQVIFETLTDYGKRYAMVQSYIPEIKISGDQRIIVIDGKVIPYALARMPTEGEHRGNLAAGGQGVGIQLETDTLKMAEHVARVLQSKGVLFAGLDVIGNKLTEINVTSPTGIRELDKEYGLDLGKDYIDALISTITPRRA